MIICDFILMVIVIGVIVVNVLNIYLGVMLFLVVGVKILFVLWCVIIVIGFGVIGFVIVLVLILNESIVVNYENFLFVIVYWIVLWFGIVFVDCVICCGIVIVEFIFDKVKYCNLVGVILLVIVGFVLIWLFLN